MRSRTWRSPIAAIRWSGSSACSRRRSRPTRSEHRAPRGIVASAGSFLLQEARELFLEPRQAAAAVEELLLSAGPGRVRFRIDIQAHRVARLAPRGAGGELGPVGHHHLHTMVVRMRIGLHGLLFRAARSALQRWLIAEGWRLYTAGRCRK